MAHRQTTYINHVPATVQIYGMDYWPDATGIAPYTTGLAESLAARGASVSVVAGMPYYPEWTVRTGYGRRFRRTDQHNGVTVHRIRQYIPPQQSAFRRAAFETTFLVGAMMPSRRRRPDIVIGAIPALSNGVLAARAAKKHGAPLILIIQDLLGQGATQSGIQGGQRVAGIASRIEGWFCRQAAAIGIVAEGFRPRLIDMGVDPERIHRVRNWTHIQQPTLDAAATRDALGLPQHARIALHAGNMGLKQGLDNIIDSARIAARSVPDLLFVLMGDGSQRTHLVDLAAGLPNVHFIAPQDNDMFPNVLAAADVLLVNQLPTVMDMSLPSKLTSYFSVGKPIVAAVAAGSETEHEVTASGGGIVVDPSRPQDTLAAIRSLVDDPALAASIGERGKQYAQQTFTAEAALARLAEIIARATLNTPEAAQDVLVS